uniref:Hexosyltransferase n=1 Tax=Cynoglossus semilaevis TaxID=244447 RepID=A0A3P8X594_CYNSE
MAWKLWGHVPLLRKNLFNCYLRWREAVTTFSSRVGSMFTLSSKKDRNIFLFSLMERKTSQIKHMFVGILGLATIYIIYINTDRRWEMWNRPQVSYVSNNLSENIEEYEEPEFEDPGPYHVAYPKRYPVVMDNTYVCRTKNPFLILIIPVAPSNVEDRDAIRQTWGGEKMVHGQERRRERQRQLRWENEQHHDMIQSNFLDSYRNLTIKTMFMLEWVVENCRNTSYIMKIDSDMLVHVPNLVKLLVDSRTPEENYMSGLVWWHSPVLRDPGNRFYLPPEVITEPEYPPYPLGMAYIMSLDVPGKLLSVSTHIKPIYIEDAYLGMCLKFLGILPINPPEPGMFLVDPEHPLSDCNLSRVVAMTTPNIRLMKSYWDRIKDPQTKC